MDLVLAGLVGTALGTILTLGATLLLDLLKRKHERRSLWESRRYQAITKYAASVKLQSRTAVMVAENYWRTYTRTPISSAEGRQRFAQYENERAEIWEQMKFLTSDLVVEAGAKWHKSVWALQGIADDEHLDEQEFDRRAELAGILREKFWAAVKKDHPVGR